MSDVQKFKDLMKELGQSFALPTDLQDLLKQESKYEQFARTFEPPKQKPLIEEYEPSKQTKQLRQQLTEQTVTAQQIKINPDLTQKKFKQHAETLQQLLDTQQFNERDADLIKRKLLFDTPLECLSEIPLANLLLCALNPRARMSKDHSLPLLVFVFYQQYGDLNQLIDLLIDYHHRPGSHEIDGDYKKAATSIFQKLLECQFLHESAWKHRLNKYIQTDEQLREDLISAQEEKEPPKAFDTDKVVRVASQVALHIHSLFLKVNWFQFVAEKVTEKNTQQEKIRIFEYSTTQLEACLRQNIQSEAEWKFWVHVLQNLIQQRAYQEAQTVQAVLRLDCYQQFVKSTFEKKEIENMKELLNVDGLINTEKQDKIWPKTPLIQQYVKDFADVRTVLENLTIKSIEADKIKQLDQQVRFAAKARRTAWDGEIDASLW